MRPALLPMDRESLGSRVHAELREALLTGRFRPGQRLKISELSEAMGVSETPVREAVMQLVREGGLQMQAGRTPTVVRLGLERYLELREIRLLLEGLATERATLRLDDADIAGLERIHAELVEAERQGDWQAALRTNYRFHATIYRAAAMPDLLTILEGIWLKNGPLITLMYPLAPPTYDGRHQHENVLDALRRRDPAAAREAIRADTLEGGRLLVELLGQLDDGRARAIERDDGGITIEGFQPKG